jgi:predicted DCC family thiol-disulfide oxidoreductase YuxK
MPSRSTFTSTKVSPSSEMNHHGTIDLLYDSECPICAMEVEFLKKRDIDHKIRFTDLSSPDYNPAEHGNVAFVDGMRKIRAILPDNTVVTGVEVFRQTYEAIGLGWVFEITKIPIVGQAADALYDFWAENRLRITGRGDLADILKDRSETLRNAEPVECTDACELDFDD